MAWRRLATFLLWLFALAGCAKIASPDAVKAQEMELATAQAQLKQLQEDIMNLPLLQKQVEDLEKEKRRLLKRRQILLKAH